MCTSISDTTFSACTTLRKISNLFKYLCASIRWMHFHNSWRIISKCFFFFFFSGGRKLIHPGHSQLFPVQASPIRGRQDSWFIRIVHGWPAVITRRGSIIHVIIIITPHHHHHIRCHFDFLFLVARVETPVLEGRLAAIDKYVWTMSW